MPFDLVPELSAVASRPAPRSIRLAAPRLSKEASRVADVGCGYMQGTRELLKHHEHVYAIDSERQRHRISRQIESCEADPRFAGFRTWEAFRHMKLRLGGAYVVNVLHTLSEVEDRIALLDAVRKNLKAGGFALLDVPYYEHYYEGRMTAENAFRDGYLFRQGTDKYTFYRFTKVAELDSWAEEAGLHFDFRIVDNHHWVRIYRPT